jgi:predicted anti-sigma-YlaC factor YlaD
MGRFWSVSHSPAARCELARRRASEELDGELGRTAFLGLRVHLAVCPACRLFARELRSLTLVLREAGLEATAHRRARFDRARSAGLRSLAAATTLAALVTATVVVDSAPTHSVKAFPALQEAPLHDAFSPPPGVLRTSRGRLPHGVI